MSSSSTSDEITNISTSDASSSYSVSEIDPYERGLRLLIDDYIWYKRADVMDFTVFPERIQKRVDPEQIPKKKRKIFDMLDDIVDMTREQIQEGTRNIDKINRKIDDLRRYFISNFNYI